MNKTNDKAITLIALVITIVVLIILAAVAINLSLGNNGIFNRAKTAKEQYSNAEDYEQTEIGKTVNEIDNYVAGNRNYESEIEALKSRIADLEKANYYSTEEIIIGKWTDNKPIYRKVINGLSFAPAINNWANTPVSITNLNRVINCELGQGAGYLPFLASKSGNTVQVYNTTGGTYTYTTMIVDYTKTTD